MKKTFFLLALAALPLTSFVSCDDDDDDDSQSRSIKVVSTECSESLGTVTGRHKVYMDCTLDSVTGELTIVIDSIYALEKPTLKLDSSTVNATGNAPYSCISGAALENVKYDVCYLSLTNSGLNLEPFDSAIPSDQTSDTIVKLDAKTYNLYRASIKLSGVSKDFFVEVESGVYLGLASCDGKYLLDPLRRYYY